MQRPSPGVASMILYAFLYDRGMGFISLGSVNPRGRKETEKTDQLTDPHNYPQTNHEREFTLLGSLSSSVWRTLEHVSAYFFSGACYCLRSTSTALEGLCHHRYSIPLLAAHLLLTEGAECRVA